jgi:DNA-binding transcriptional MerR regulator
MGRTIGSVAKEAGVSVDTIRFYEKGGLLPAAPRRDSGYRDYPEETARRLSFIRNAREIGFTLSEIGELLSLREEAQSPCERVQKMAMAKLGTVRERIRNLREIEGQLEALVEACTGRTPPECPLLDRLGQGSG